MKTFIYSRIKRGQDQHETRSRSTGSHRRDDAPRNRKGANMFQTHKTKRWIGNGSKSACAWPARQGSSRNRADHPRMLAQRHITKDLRRSRFLSQPSSGDRQARHRPRCSRRCGQAHLPNARQSVPLVTSLYPAGSRRQRVALRLSAGNRTKAEFFQGRKRMMKMMFNGLNCQWYSPMLSK